MSHITQLKADIQFMDEVLLNEALSSLGTTLDGTHAKSVVFKEGQIKNLTFISQGQEWIARADNWGMEQEYKILIRKIQTNYQMAAIRTIFKENHYNTTAFTKESTVIGRRY